MSRENISKNWISGTASVFALTLSYRVLGFLRESATASFLGNSMESDAYYIAYSIPSIIPNIFAWGAMAAAAIPLMTPYINNQDQLGFNRYVSRVLNFFMLILVLCAIIMIFLSKQIVFLFAPGFDMASSTLATQFSQKMLLMLLPLGLSGLFTAALLAQKNFWATPLSHLIYNAVLYLGSILATALQNIIALVFSVIAAAVFQLIFCWIVMRKQGFRYQRVPFRINDREIVILLSAMLPICLSTLFGIANQTIGRIIASGLTQGSIASLNFAEKVYQLPLGIIVGSLVTVLLAYLSDYASNNNREKLQDLIKNSIEILSIIIIPVMLILLFFSETVVYILFERGAFSHADTIRTATALRLYALALPGVSVIELNNRLFYAYQKSSISLIIALSVATLNVVFSIILSGSMSENGIALALAISMTIGALISCLFLKKKFDWIRIPLEAARSIKFVITCAMLAASMFLISHALTAVSEGFSFFLNLISFSCAMILIALTYFFLLQFFHILPIYSYIKKGAIHLKFLITTK